MWFHLCGFSLLPQGLHVDCHHHPRLGAGTGVRQIAPELHSQPSGCVRQRNRRHSVGLGFVDVLRWPHSGPSPIHRRALRGACPVPLQPALNPPRTPGMELCPLARPHEWHERFMKVREGSPEVHLFCETPWQTLVACLDRKQSLPRGVRAGNQGSRKGASAPFAFLFSRVWTNRNACFCIVRILRPHNRSRKESPLSRMPLNKAHLVHLPLHWSTCFHRNFRRRWEPVHGSLRPSSIWRRLRCRRAGLLLSTALTVFCVTVHKKRCPQALGRGRGVL